jgi:quercetin dioxygenase-like cupin family protein
VAEIPEHGAGLATEQAGDAARPGLHLADPLLALDISAELARLRDEETWQRTGRHARTLVKDADLRVVLIALGAGMRMEEHHAPGRITIQTIVGRLTLRAAGQTVDLPVGHLLTLGPAIPHDVEAREESAFLLTIAWPT